MLFTTKNGNDPSTTIQHTNKMENRKHFLFQNGVGRPCDNFTLDELTEKVPESLRTNYY